MSTGVLDATRRHLQNANHADADQRINLTIYKGKPMTQLTKRLRDLEELEGEINKAAYEAFYYIGQKLLEIKQSKSYEVAGFKTWASYCASGRLDFNVTQADLHIRASQLRPKIGASGTDLNLKQMAELTKCETDNDAKRVVKKAIVLAKKTGEKLTAKLISQVRDGSDETGRTDTRRDARLDSASLETHLTQLSDLLVNWRKSLEKVDLNQWDSIPTKTMTRVIREVDALSKFLENDE